MPFVDPLIEQFSLSNLIKFASSRQMETSKRKKGIRRGVMHRSLWTPLITLMGLKQEEFN